MEWLADQGFVPAGARAALGRCRDPRAAPDELESAADALVAAIEALRAGARAVDARARDDPSA